MAWTYLAIAAVFEVAFALGMKLSDGFTRLWPSALAIVAAAAGVAALTLALKDLPVSVAYPIWTAVGTLGTVALGHAVFGESLTLAKAAAAAAIVAGVWGLKATAG